MSTYQIHFVAGECKGEKRELPEGAALILGRSRSATVRFFAPDISGKHLELTLLPSGDVALKNLSTHRTERNGEALSEGEAVILSVGDHITFGESSAFVLEDASKGSAGVDVAAGDATRATNFVAVSEAKVMMPALAGSKAPLPKAAHKDEAKTELPEEQPSMAQASPHALEDATVADPPAKPDSDRTVLPSKAPAEKPRPMQPPAPPAQKKPASAASEEPEEAHTASQAADDGDNETMVMQTRVATLEEMEMLRKTRKPKLDRWVIGLALGLAASAFLVGTSYVVSQTNIENPITWPKDGEKFNDEVVVPDIGVDKEFIIYFPKYRSMQVKKETNRIMALTRLGKRRDVPCRIIFHMNKSLSNLSLSRMKGFKAWQDKMMATGGQWNFDVDPNVHFRGKDHGLPYQMARYTRTVDKEAWFGVAMYIKDRDWELILQKEIPSSERYRGEDLLVETPFISVSPRYVLTHWEPGEVSFDKPVKEMLAEVKTLLNRAIPTPRMWKHILDLLRNVLISSMRNNDTATYDAAIELLRDLRTKQAQWLNSQKINYFSALAKDLPKQVAAIRQDCITAFSDEDDYRCHQLRNDKWD